MKTQGTQGHTGDKTLSMGRVKRLILEKDPVSVSWASLLHGPKNLGRYLWGRGRMGDRGIECKLYRDLVLGLNLNL